MRSICSPGATAPHSWLDSISLVPKRGPEGVKYPAGLAWSNDGRYLYVAENLGDSLAVVDVARKQVTQRFATQPYPYGVVVAPDGSVYVSAWGGNTVSAFASAAGGALRRRADVPVGRHPSAMTLSANGNRLFVASATMDLVTVVDTKALTVIATLRDAPPAGPGEGSTPNALAVSRGRHAAVRGRGGQQCGGTLRPLGGQRRNRGGAGMIPWWAACPCSGIQRASPCLETPSWP